MRVSRALIVAAATAAMAMEATALAQTPTQTPTPSPAPPATAPLAASPPPPSAAQASPAEIEFWATVKDARNPAEFKAYLETYPNGAFAALARVRIKALEDAATARKVGDDAKAAADARAAADAARAAAASAAAAKAAADARATTASALGNPAVIREMQAKLYNLNYTVGPQNGTLTNEMRAAIRQWQTNLKRQPTGDLTEAEVGMLRGATPPTIWGAIAYNVRGGSSSVWMRATRGDAENATLAECRKLKGGDCTVITAANAGCIAIGYAAGNIGSTQHTGAFGSARPNQAQAIDNALTECRAKSKVPNNCGVRTTICADGSHKK